MSALIKGMEKPANCEVCPYAFCHLDTRNCPIVEVPTPHGRLIDEDALMLEFAEFVRASNNSDFAAVPTWNDSVSLLGSAPTIIEAEEGEKSMNDKYIVHVKGDGRYTTFGTVIKTREEREILERVLSSLRIARFVDDYTVKEIGVNANVTGAK